MEKLCLVLLFNLLWIVPPPVAPAQSDGLPDVLTPITIADPIPPLKKFEKLLEQSTIRKWVTAEINGTLHYEEGLDPSIPRIPEYEEWVGYSITADGQWFGMDLGDNKELTEKAKILLGKRVVVKGTVEERSLGLIPRKTIKVVAVSELTEAAPAKEWIDMQVTGKLEARALPTSLGGPAYQFVVMVSDKQYALQIDAHADLSKQALTLDGKRVVVSGRFDQAKEFPTIQAQDVKAADEKSKDAVAMTVQGKLIRDAAKDRIQESRDWGYHTGWKLQVNGLVFPVEFGADEKLRKLAAQLDGQTVLLSGALNTVDYFPPNWKPRPRPRDEDPMPVEPRFLLAPPMRQAQVLRATDLKTVDKDSVQETDHLEIEGKLEHHVLQSCPVQHDWFITAQRNTYHLRFGPDVPREKPERLAGASVLITGTLDNDGTVLVTSLSPACRG